MVATSQGKESRKLINESGQETGRAVAWRAVTHGEGNIAGRLREGHAQDVPAAKL